jgi:hypothetical protein
MISKGAATDGDRDPQTCTSKILARVDDLKILIFNAVTDEFDKPADNITSYLLSPSGTPLQSPSRSQLLSTPKKKNRHGTYIKLFIHLFTELTSL